MLWILNLKMKMQYKLKYSINQYVIKEYNLTSLEAASKSILNKTKEDHVEIIQTTEYVISNSYKVKTINKKWVESKFNAFLNRPIAKEHKRTSKGEELRHWFTVLLQVNDVYYVRVYQRAYQYMRRTKKWRINLHREGFVGAWTNGRYFKNFTSSFYSVYPKHDPEFKYVLKSAFKYWYDNVFSWNFCIWMQEY